MVLQRSEFIKSGRNASVVKMKLKNLFSNTTTESVYKAVNMIDVLNYIVDGMGDICQVTFYEGKAISAELPSTITREVEYTEPVIRGNTTEKL